MGFPEAAQEPPKLLKGFRKVGPLSPGVSATVSFELDRPSLAIWSSAQSGWTVVPGQYTVYVGSSAQDIRLHGSFTISQ